MSNNINKKQYFSPDEIEEKSLIKESSELEVQSLYQILIKNPYLVNTIDDKKETILSYSIKNNNIEISNLIITSPIIDLDYQDKKGNSYLHLAVTAQQKEIIKLLLEKGIDINKQNQEGNTALHLAYSINNKQIINYLIENGIDDKIVNKENKVAEDLVGKNRKLNSSLNNRIKVTKNKEINKKKDTKNTLEKNKKRSSNIITSNTNRNKKENNINNNSNNGKSILSSKPGNKTKVKTMPSSQEVRKNNKAQNINLINDNKEKTYNNINNSPYKRNNNNDDDLDEEYSEFDRTVKIDWDSTNDNINKIKENEDDHFLNYNYKENNNYGGYGGEQDLCNVEVSKSFCNQKNDNISEKVPTKLKDNKKIINNNTTNNKASIKPKKKENGKINRNNCLSNSAGYNPCIHGDYTIKSEQRHSKKPSGNLFGSKIDISQSQNNEQNNNKNNQYNECKRNSLHKKNDNYNNNEKKNINTFRDFSGNSNKKQNDIIVNMNKNIIKNSPKRKIGTSNSINRPILISNKNLEENNSNIKSSNMESSLVTQSRLKTSHNKNKPLMEFLSQINLLKYLNNLDSNGFDDINLLIEEAKKGDLIKDQELKEAGINSPGDRAKILIRLKEKANIFGFTIPKSVYYTCKNFDDIENDQHIIDLNNWLSVLKVDKYLMNFVNNGYHSIELLLMQMETENPLTTEILRDEIGIDKIGYRSRILNKLKEEARSLSNKLKTSVLVVNGSGDDKNCECIIF